MSASFVFVPVGLVVVAFGFWRLFRSQGSPKPNAQNNWKNENFLAREATGSWAEDAQIGGESAAPKPVPGQGAVL